jgi:hypothetical protein
MPIIYVGYGVDAAGRVIADVRGKVAVMLMANRAGEDPMSAADRRLALGAAGAAGVLLIPDPRFGFDALAGSFSRPRGQLTEKLPATQIEGLITIETADALLRVGGVDPEQARGARLPGRYSGPGTVALMGHWDHLGLCRPAGAPDRICNGAVDNASGIAVLLETARHLGSGPRLDRDIVVIATTGEEMGLLGAEYFASHPTLRLADIRILLNVDTVAITPRGTPMAIIGRGTPADTEIEGVARALGRAIDSDGDADSFVRRQDGYAMQRHGVPAVMAGGSFSDMALLQHFIAGPYHGPDDELTDATELGGAADDADLHIALARHFATDGAARH